MLERETEGSMSEGQQKYPMPEWSKDIVQSETAAKDAEIIRLKNRLHDEIRSAWLCNERLREANLAANRHRTAAASLEEENKSLRAEVAKLKKIPYLSNAYLDDVGDGSDA